MNDARGTVELIACETCGSAERETHGSTRGERLLAALRAARDPGSPVEVSSVRCLWACSKSCAVHVRAPDRPGYVLCNFEPSAEAARGILDWAALYAASSDGAVPYKQWPAAVRGHFLCRVPPPLGTSARAPETLRPGPRSPEDPMNKLPTTIVTGFLGSGKTTLLRHLLTNADGRRLAVIVNEFGEVGVDGELLKQCGIGCETSEDGDAGSLYELSNGCLCCTVQEEFVPVLETLMERRDRIDHILIETSGLALPKPLVQAFQWPQIRSACTVDAVIALVDGPAVLSGQFAADPAAVDRQRREDPSLDHERPLVELFEDQLTAADLVILSKVDAMSADDVAKVKQEISARVAPGVKIITASHGALPFDVVLGLQRATEDTIDARHTHHDEDHAAGREHSHELFDTIVLRFGTLDRDALLRGLSAVVREHEVYRAKGFAAVSGKAMRLVVQGVGSRFDSYFDRAWQPGETPATELVLIGEHLDSERITRTLLAAAES